MNSKHAIITGGSSGIGLAIAHKLVVLGWKVTLIARNVDNLNRAVLSLNVPANQTQLFAADVSNNAQISHAINESIKTFGTPELLITSAGIARPGHFQALEPHVFQDAMNINYFGTLFAIQAVAPAMRKAGTGHVVMISSGAALIGVYGYSAYCPSKFAIRGLAEVLRGEFKPDGVNVSVVYPPDTDTPQLAEENKTKPEETFAISGNAQTWKADDVANAILKGVKKNKFSITPGLEMTALGFLASIINPLLQRYFDHLVIKVRKS